MERRCAVARTGARMPVLGMGTWMMATDPSRRGEEIAALQVGLDLGLTLIDTAEMYADGGAEEVVAEAIRGRREEVYLVTKVLPGNASRAGTVAACERSLERLRTDRIDLYLLHWESSHPLEGTLAAFERLRGDGKILDYGVSNFDLEWMRRSEALPGGQGVACDQVYYNLRRRGIERTILPWCAERGVVVMAYTPLESGKLAAEPGLTEVARRHGATPAQVALAWTLRHPGVVSIPKSSTSARVKENAAALRLALTAQDLASLDAAFPPPSRDLPLETV